MSTGVIAIPRRKAKAETATRRRSIRLAPIITVALGTGIPLLSLALSSLGGKLIAGGSPWLGVVALGLCVSVLGVSLSHLAWAVGDITRSPQWASWCLAVTVDLSLVLCELVGCSGTGADVERLRLALMISVTGASQCLNTWAFIRNR